MEFGIFIQGFVPGYRREADPDAEHTALLQDIECVIAADKAGFKYVWATEHHFLDEYSHLSANDAVLGYLAHATERIHLGSGIFNPLPQVNHPAKVAERVAMLDHLSGGRFEFGTGRGAGTGSPTRTPPGQSGRRRSANSPRCSPRRSTRVSRATPGLCHRARSCPSRTRSRTRPCGMRRVTRRATRWPAGWVSGYSVSP